MITVDNVNYGSLQQERNNLALYLRACTELEHWCCHYLLKIFQDINSFFPEKIYELTEIRNRITPLPSYFPLIDSLLEMLNRRKFISFNTDTTYRLCHYEFSLDNKSLKKQQLILIKKYPFLQPEIMFMESLLDAYLHILNGSKSYLSVMFPEGRFDYIEAIYKMNADSTYHCKLLASTLESLLQKQSPNSHIKILELGAGVGSASQYTLPLFNNHEQLSKTYYYTDISRAFIKYGEQHYSDRYQFMICKPLNMEVSPSVQGFNIKEYDFVIAANVLHTTKNILGTLENIKQLLKPGGYLILSEATKKRDFSTLAFGLATGWCINTDSWRIQDTPFVSSNNWLKILSMSGFKNAYSLIETFEPDTNNYQDIIIATKST